MHRQGRQGHNQQGQVAVLFAVTMVVLLGMLALAVDGGLLYVQRRWAQNVADAAALATARYLGQSWTGGVVAGSDSAAYGIATSYGPKNSSSSTSLSMRLDYVDQSGTVIATHPTTVPANARGVQITASLNNPAGFARVLGFQSLPATAKSTAMFGPAGTGIGVAPIAVDDSLQGDSSRLQPAGGSSGGNYVNASLINSAAFGSHQDFFDALRNGVRDNLVLGQSYPTSAPDHAQWRPAVVAALQDRISRGQARGDSPTHFTADSPQLLIVPTIQGGFGDAGSPVTLYRFRAFFLQAVDPSGNWVQGTFVSAPLGNGSIDFRAPYGGVTVTRLIR